MSRACSYASPAIHTSQKLVPLNSGHADLIMRLRVNRAVTFALEIAMDELACKLNMDPIQLRLKNYAEKDPTSNKPFSEQKFASVLCPGCGTLSAGLSAILSLDPPRKGHRVDRVGHGNGYLFGQSLGRVGAGSI